MAGPALLDGPGRNSITASVRSLNTLNEVEDDMAKQSTFMHSLLKSLKAEIDIELEPEFIPTVI